MYSYYHSLVNNAKLLLASFNSDSEKEADTILSSWLGYTSKVLLACLTRNGKKEDDLIITTWLGWPSKLALAFLNRNGKKWLILSSLRASETITRMLNQRR